jgi:cardiolipin synthase
MPINVPNMLTVLRVLLTPLFVICVMREMLGFALLVFAIASVSDALDGLLARWLRQRTTFGAYLDPVADKLLMTATYVVLAVYAIMPSWLAVLVISRDVLISVGVFVMLAVAHRREDIPPSRISKWNTICQALTVLFVLTNALVPLHPLSGVVLYAATGTLTVASGIHYLYVGLNVLHGDEDGGEPS